MLLKQKNDILCTDSYLYSDKNVIYTLKYLHKLLKFIKIYKFNLINCSNCFNGFLFN